MRLGSLSICLVLSVSGCAHALQFERARISDVTYEAASIFDVDNDGTKDIVSGEYWFSGPDFKNGHRICQLQKYDDYFDDFADIPMDVDGDGFLDIVTGAWWGGILRWRKNPGGRDALWETFDVDKCGNIETIRCWDVDGDGRLEVVPNTPGGPLRVYKIVLDGTGKPKGEFSRHLVFEQNQGHGLGFGDVDGDGIGDFVLSGGWLKAPKDTFTGKWAWYPEFNLGGASVPIIVFDVDKDGLSDLIVGQGHDYGLAWWKQVRDPHGKRGWGKNDVDPNSSQYHDMMLVDIDNDSDLELITGKRYRAHGEKDPGSLDPIGVYYFEINKGNFERVVIDYGPAGQASGVGIFFWVDDINGDGFKDILAPGKEGLFLFKNLGPAR